MIKIQGRVTSLTRRIAAEAAMDLRAGRASWADPVSKVHGREVSIAALMQVLETDSLENAFDLALLDGRGEVRGVAVSAKEQGVNETLNALLGETVSIRWGLESEAMDSWRLLRSMAAESLLDMDAGRSGWFSEVDATDSEKRKVLEAILASLTREEGAPIVQDPDMSQETIHALYQVFNRAYEDIMSDA